MDFDHYVEVAAGLVDADLSSGDSLREHLAGRDWLAERAVERDLRPLRRLQAELAAVVDASVAGDEKGVVVRVNRLLAEVPIRPRISGHDAGSWHLHVRDVDASIAEVLAAEAVFGLTLLVTEAGATRLGRCAAAGCSRTFVDLSTNRSRRFCSTRCATRTNVANFRMRRQSAAG